MTHSEPRPDSEPAEPFDLFLVVERLMRPREIQVAIDGLYRTIGILTENARGAEARGEYVVVAAPGRVFVVDRRPALRGRDFPRVTTGRYIAPDNAHNTGHNVGNDRQTPADQAGPFTAHRLIGTPFGPLAVNDETGLCRMMPCLRMAAAYP